MLSSSRIAEAIAPSQGRAPSVLRVAQIACASTNRSVASAAPKRPCDGSVHCSVSLAASSSSASTCVAGRRERHCVISRAAASDATPDSDVEVSKAVTSIIQYALQFARVSETYEAHSWMILLGVLKHEDSRAATILKDMGLDDLYGAWHEVLWALHASNGLTQRAFTNDVRFSNRCFRIVVAASNFASYGGRTKVQSEDLLMALAAGEVLTGVFPDLDLSFERVKEACAKHGSSYNLPATTEEAAPA